MLLPTFQNINNVGAVYLGTSTLTMDVADFSGNLATGPTGGGAIYMQNGAVLNVTDTGSMFNNSASNGGGSYCSNSTMYFPAAMEFTQNVATNGSGGGVYLRLQCNLIAQSDVTFDGNAASKGRGGAMFITESSTASTTDSVSFTNNKASIGGAYYIESRGKYWTTTNAYLFNNVAPSGSAFALRSKSLMSFSWYANITSNNGLTVRRRILATTADAAMTADNSTLIMGGNSTINNTPLDVSYNDSQLYCQPDAGNYYFLQCYTSCTGTYIEPALGQPDKMACLAISTDAPTTSPSAAPTQAGQTKAPTIKPTSRPTAPTSIPTKSPTALPTSVPTGSPTAGIPPPPTAIPTAQPSAMPTPAPTPFPTTLGPTRRPTLNDKCYESFGSKSFDYCGSANGCTVLNQTTSTPSGADCFAFCELEEDCYACFHMPDSNVCLTLVPLPGNCTEAPSQEPTAFPSAVPSIQPTPVGWSLAPSRRPTNGLCLPSYGPDVFDLCESPGGCTVLNETTSSPGGADCNAFCMEADDCYACVSTELACFSHIHVSIEVPSTKAPNTVHASSLTSI